MGQARSEAEARETPESTIHASMCLRGEGIARYPGRKSQGSFIYYLSHNIPFVTDKHICTQKVAAVLQRQSLVAVKRP